MRVEFARIPEILEKQQADHEMNQHHGAHLGTMLLYIHPHGHIVSDRIVPHGAFYTLNTVPNDKLGIYSMDLDERLVARAQVVLIDVHWPFAIHPARKICEYVKSVSPGVPIIAGGFIVDTFMDMVLDVVPADYLVYHNAEVSLKQLVECLLQGAPVPDLPNVVRNGMPPGPLVFSTQEQFNSLNFTDYSWFPELHSRGYRTQDNVEYHMVLTRGCCAADRLASSVAKCNISSAHGSDGLLFRTPEQLDTDLDELDQSSPAPERLYVYLYAGAISQELMDEYLRVIQKKRNITIWFFFCQTLSEKLLDFLEWRGQSLGVYVLLNCYSAIQAEGIMELSPDNRRLMARILEHGGLTVEDLEKNAAPDQNQNPFVMIMEIMPHPEDRSVSVEVTKPINWKTPPRQMHFESERARFDYMCDLGNMVNRMLPLRLFAPGVYARYGFSDDPQTRIPDMPQWSDAFNRAVLKGYNKWGLLVPDSLDYRAVFVGCPPESIPECGYFHARIPTLTPLERKSAGVDLKVDERGWTVALHNATCSARADMEPCVVILPEDLENAVELAKDFEVLVLALRALAPSRTFRIVDEKIIGLNSL